MYFLFNEVTSPSKSKTKYLTHVILHLMPSYLHFAVTISVTEQILNKLAHDMQKNVYRF